MNGTDIFKSLPPTLCDAREAQIFSHVMNGSYVLEWNPISVDYGGYRATFLVSNALRLGNAYDSIRVSLTMKTLQRIADRLGCALLTAGLADAAYAQADVKLAPHPMGTTNMTATQRMLDYNAEVKKLVGSRTGLTVNEGKDWVIHTNLVAKPVAADGGVSAVNYGWYQKLGTYPGLVSCSITGSTGVGVIQGPYTAHNWDYTDYSQLGRLVWRPVFVCTTGVVSSMAHGSTFDGNTCKRSGGADGFNTVMDIYEMMGDASYRKFLNMGNLALTFMRHPKVPWEVPSGFVPPDEINPPSGNVPPAASGNASPIAPPTTPQPPPPSGGSPTVTKPTSSSLVAPALALAGAGVLAYLGTSYLTE